MDENNGNPASSSFKLLQPDLMTIQELCEILRACCVKNDLTSYTKSELVELFKRVALPLPQRDYGGNSWREKLLLKKQKRKVTDTAERDNIKRICTANGSARSSTLASPSNTTSPSSGPSSISRLKPPVNLNSYTKKVLKLALPNSKSSDSVISRKIVINEKKEIKSQEKNATSTDKKIIITNQVKEVTSQEVSKSATTNEKPTLSNGKHKRIVIDFSDTSTSSTKTPKLINLKRSSHDEIPSPGRKVRKTVNI